MYLLMFHGILPTVLFLGERIAAGMQSQPHRLVQCFSVRPRLVSSRGITVSLNVSDQVETTELRRRGSDLQSPERALGSRFEDSALSSKAHHIARG